MPPKPKFRLFGAPNGSGKTHIFREFKAKGIIHTEVYVNADRIEAELKEKRRFSFNAYRVKVSEAGLGEYILASGLFHQKIKDKTFVEHFTVNGGVLRIGRQVAINSYHASFIASYLAERLFETKQSFAFETVMSHESKVELLKQARDQGYKTYFYFIFADSISTNITRVKLRVLDGGHGVKDETIAERAVRTFQLLPAAFNSADTAYVIDNSNEAIAILSKDGTQISRTEEFAPIIRKPILQILARLGKEYAIGTRG